MKKKPPKPPQKKKSKTLLKPLSAHYLAVVLCYSVYVQKIFPKFIKLRLFLACILIFAFVFSFIGTLHAQEVEASKEEQKRQLEQMLQELEAEIRAYEDQINKHRSEKEGFQREVNILDSEISKLQAQIRRGGLELNEIEFSIVKNEDAITLLEEKIEIQKNLLANLLLGMYRTQDTNSLEIILANDTLSDFFDDVKGLEELREGLKVTLDAVQALREQIQAEQNELEARREDQLRIIAIQEDQKGALKQKVDDKEVFVEASRAKEQEFQELAKRTQKSISEVRNQLFVLEGTSTAIPFEQAYELAKLAESYTGVRPAFLLSLLKQESGRGALFGANVGTCTWRQDVQGKPVMNPTRDQPAFEIIASELGFNPDTQIISCPWIRKGKRVGWGGAMGPAQFIPSTWIAYKDKVSQLVGAPANPWNIRDAFLAAAVKLQSHGADSRTHDAEWKAAMVYFAGGGWRNASYAWYGNQVMSRAKEIQQDINVLEKG